MSGAFDTILGDTPKKKAGGGGAFSAVLGGGNDVAALEQRAAESGAPSIPQDSTGLASRAIDILSRPNYAVAGGIEELLTGLRSGTAPGEIAKNVGKRELSEVFSGAFGQKGQKRGFGEVLERQGVPELGSVNVPNPLPIVTAPFAPTIDVAKARVQEAIANPVKITGRGTLGLGLDIAADPTNLITFGAGAVKSGGVALSKQGVKLLGEELAKAAAEGVPRAAAREAADMAVLKAAAKAPELLDLGGLKIAGVTIPGTPTAAAAIRQKASGVTKSLAETLDKYPLGRKALEGAAKTKDTLNFMFRRDIYGREIPGYLADKQAFLDNQALLESTLKDKAREALKPLAKRGGQKRFETIAKAFEKGDLSSLTEPERKAMEAMKTLSDAMAQDEVARGLLPAERLVGSYFPHYYENTPEEIQRVIDVTPRSKTINRATVGRHAEERAFPTFEDAVRASTEAHAVDKSVPILRPIYDPFKAFGRRIEAHASATSFDDFYRTIGQRYGKQFAPEQFFDLSREAYGAKPSAELKAIEAQLAHPHKPTEFVGRLTPEGKQEYLRRQFMKQDTAKGLLGTMERFSDQKEFFPKVIQDLSGLDAYDGTVYEKLTGIKALKDVDLPGGIAQDLKHIAASHEPWGPKQLAPFVRGYDRANNAFKSYVTVLFPSFHARNLYSNVAQAFADVGISALSPALHADTVGVLAGGEGTFKTWLGEKYSYDELRQLIDQNQIRVSGKQALEFTGESPLREGLKEKIAGATGGIETEARVQLFLNYLRRGASPSDAAARVKEVLFDYSNLSEFEKRVMRRLVPFYTWTRKNISRQVYNLTHRPGLVAAEVKPFRGRESEDKMLTQYDAEGMKIRLDRNGRTLTALQGVDLPIRDLDRIWGGSVQRTLRSNLAMVAPAIQAPIQVAMGRTFFSGKDLTRQESAGIGRVAEHMPKPIQQWLGYRKDLDSAGRPKYTFNGERFYILFQSWLASRIVSTTDRQFKTYASDPRWGPLLLDTLTGMKLKNWNLDEEQAKRVAERERQLHEALVKQGEEYQIQVNRRRQ